MLKYKRSIVSLTPYCLSFFLMLTITLLSSAAETDINEKVSQLIMSNATLDDVIRIFGEPEKYAWSGETFTKDNLPSVYLASYDSGKFQVFMKAGTVNEIRFRQGQTGYVYKDKIRLGSSLNEVIEVVGQPKQTVTGQAIDYQEGVLYKDANGRKGYCYYKPAGQNVRFFFSDERVSAIYLTAGQGREKPVMDINAKVSQLDMNNSTLDDVIRIFGEPEKYFLGRETFTKDNLPSTYTASYDSGGFQIYIEADKINEIRFESSHTGYLYKDKIRPGSSLDEVLEVVGKPERTVVGQAVEWEEGVLYKDIDGTKGFCYYKPADQDVRFFFGNYKVNGLYLTAPKSVVGDSVKSSKPITPITSVERFDNVLWKDMSKLDLSDRRGLIVTLDFNLETVWPIPKGLPKGPHPKIVLSRAMNPGLGIKRLHREGITGKGVNVAIIDQPMYLDHPEFSGKIAKYYDTGCGTESSMHGPAVTSLLVGNRCGTAPDAKVYYAAAPSWTKDTSYQAKALDWIIEQNRSLPASGKIRVVSVSAAPSGQGSPFEKNQQMWDEACSRAEAEGILVLDCTSHRGIISACWYDANDPENVSKCTLGFPGRPRQGFSSKRIFVPSSPRTTAEERDKGKFGYQYTGRGGLSWTIPYCAGVLAMGWQINPQLSSEQMRELLFQSAYKKESGAKIINPVEFIKLVRKTKVAQKQM